jgi:hypothetical protein
MTADYATNQRACAKLLAAILDRAAAYERKIGREVPTLVWTIGYDGMSATIDEHTSGIGTDALFAQVSQRQGFDWWVDILNAERVADRIGSDGRRFLSAQLRTNDTVVVLRTHLPASATFPCAWSGKERTGNFLLIDDHNSGVWVSEQAWDEFITKSREQKTIITFKVLRTVDAADLAKGQQS